MRRHLKALVSLPALVLVALFLGGCDDPGEVAAREWNDMAVGKDTCTLTIQPDKGPTDEEPPSTFKMKNQNNARCNACPPGARWPTCAVSKENDEEPTPPKETVPWQPGPDQQTWDPGPDDDKPIGVVGQPCSPDNAKGNTAQGQNLRCKNGKWKRS